MKPDTTSFRETTPMERRFNRAFGFLIGLGLGRRFLVAGRGRTQWVRNAEVAGEVTLKKGRSRQRFRARPVADADTQEAP